MVFIPLPVVYGGILSPFRLTDVEGGVAVLGGLVLGLVVSDM